MLQMGKLTPYMFVVISLALNITKVHAQDLNQLFISCHWKNKKLIKAFDDIQEQTGFNFAYNVPVIRQVKVSYQSDSVSFLKVLKSITINTGLKFSKLRKTIYVSKGENSIDAIMKHFDINEAFVDSVEMLTNIVQPKVIHKVSILDNNLGQSLRGKVVDVDNEMPLIGATVLVKETGYGTVTDNKGYFNVNIPPSRLVTLVSTYVGYEPIEQVFEGETYIKVGLKPSISDLAEVLVVGYGEQIKRNVTGSVAQIKKKSIMNRPVTQASQALHGLVPGVFINVNSGEPGNDQANITIRGIGTLNNSNPLILIDGIEAPINSINPGDIEQINVLKDAASASIYGSRAANGVILITTKKSQMKEGKQLDYDFYMGISNPTVLPKMIWDNRTYMTLYREAAQNSLRQFGFSDEDILRYDSLPSTDWTKQLVRNNVPSFNHNLALRHSGKDINYYVSLGYLDQSGFLEGNQAFERYTARLNLDAQLNHQWKFGTSFSYTNESGNLTPKDRTGRSFQDKGSLVFSGAWIQHPMVPVYDRFGRYGSIESALGIERNRPNGQAVVDNESVLLTNHNLLGKIFLEYELLEDLVIRSTIGLNYQNETIDDIKKEYVTFDPITGNPWSNGNGTRNRGSIFNRQSTSQINLTTWLQSTYTREWGIHKLKALLGINREKALEKATQIIETEFGSKDLVQIGNGTLVETNGQEGEWGLASIFSRVNYNLGDKYLFEVNLRRDGSSRFGVNNRWAMFPAISWGWIASNEGFWNLDFISLVKLRGSWGKLGNTSTNLYPFASQVELGRNYNNNSGAAVNRLGNPNLKWEETTIFDLGIDMEFLAGKINTTLDYFYKRTDDILTELDNPLTAGINATTTVNAAKIRNVGWEVSLQYQDKVGPVKFNIGGNVSHIDNKVLAINPVLGTEEDRIRIDREDNIWIVRGASIYAMWGHQMEGIFQTQEEIENAPDHSFIGQPAPGDFRYKDINGDGKITPEDQVVIGNRQPKWLYGIHLNASYKQFNFSVLFQGIGRADVYVARMYGPFPFAGLRRYWENRWTPDNPKEDIPRLFIDRRGYNGQSISTADKMLSFWVQDRSYLRLKNIQVSYTLPESIFGKKWAPKNLKVYINGQNLWTLTDLIDIDPERFTLESHATATLPQNKTITFGINATF